MKRFARRKILTGLCVHVVFTLSVACVLHTREAVAAEAFKMLPEVFFCRYYATLLYLLKHERREFDFC